jgi:hypothetical protein
MIITIDCFKSVRYNPKVSHRRHIYKHRLTSNISHINIKNVYICLRTKLDILKTNGPSATVKNYNIRTGAILSFYILQNITLTNYAYSLNTHYYIPFHDCVCD